MLLCGHGNGCCKNGMEIDIPEKFVSLAGSGTVHDLEGEYGTNTDIHHRLDWNKWYRQ